MPSEYRTSVSNLKLTKSQFDIIDTMSYRAKALYNSSLYQLNGYYKAYQDGLRLTYTDKNGTSKEKGSYMGYQDLDKLMKTIVDDNGYIVYKGLPAQVSQQVLMKLDQNFKSFFSLLSMKQNNTYDKTIDTPNYLKKDDRKELVFVKSKTSSSFIFKDGYIHITVPKDLHKGRLRICKVPKYIEHLDFDKDIKTMEIVPKLNSYELHITYNKEIKEPGTDIKNWMSIDLGMNNLMAVSSNVTKPFLINGRPIKSINQKYNKRIGKLKSKTKKSQGKNTSKRIQQEYNKRGYKLNNEIHKITDFLVKSILDNGIDHVVVGYNKEWKDGISLGKKTNQNFVQIPFSKILQQLEYKLREQGIELYLQEESYTSKCSYFDNEEVRRHRTYKGTRSKRGLFTTAGGQYINADINGSLNIYRKFLESIKKNEVHHVYLVLSKPLDVGLVMNPIKINLQTAMSNPNVTSLLQLIKAL